MRQILKLTRFSRLDEKKKLIELIKKFVLGKEYVDFFERREIMQTHVLSLKLTAFFLRSISAFLFSYWKRGKNRRIHATFSSSKLSIDFTFIVVRNWMHLMNNLSLNWVRIDAAIDRKHVNLSEMKLKASVSASLFPLRKMRRERRVSVREKER